jgi:5-methylcytosine-specific restriction endonuclease McrA
MMCRSGNRLTTVKPSRLSVPKKAADPHYLTPEHQQWRTAVLDRAGHKCEGCGRTNTRLFADHVVELRDGGAPLEFTNGRALCGACHTRKTARERGRRQRRRDLDR